MEGQVSIIEFYIEVSWDTNGRIYLRNSRRLCWESRIFCPGIFFLCIVCEMLRETTLSSMAIFLILIQYLTTALERIFFSSVVMVLALPYAVVWYCI